MLNFENIKWCAVQPLTGGMYLAAEKLVGHPAEFILSYPGVGDPRYSKKTEELIGAGNEYHLMKYLQKHNRRPEYKVFNRKQFQLDEDMNPEIISTDWTINPDKDLDYSDMDLCVAVPVCSGMSNAATSSTETRNVKNCNMTYISKYVINVIKPKIYIFENAPTFMGNRGDLVRVQLEKLAEENEYSLIYYKTDTKFHDNCQTRKRTFIIFFKKEFAPKMDFEHIEVSNKEYFDRIPNEYRMKSNDLTFLNVNGINEVIVGYLKKKLGENWRTIVGHSIHNYLYTNNLFEELKQYTYEQKYPEKREEGTIKFFNHLLENLAQNRGIYHAFPFITTNEGNTPAVMFKMVQGCLHYNEDRPLNTGELLHLMGMPFDFEMYGEPSKIYPQIGQNVPMRTAYFIIKAAIDAYNKENDLNEIQHIRYFNNMTQQELKYNKK